MSAASFHRQSHGCLYDHEDHGAIKVNTSISQANYSENLGAKLKQIPRKLIEENDPFFIITGPVSCCHSAKT